MRTALPADVKQSDLLVDLQKMFNLYFMPDAQDPKLLYIEPFKDFYSSEAIDWTLNILGGLQGSLDMERGGDVANNLSNLYDYMMRRLVEANTVNDPAVLDEVSRLMGEIREAWIAIRN